MSPDSPASTPFEDLRSAIKTVNKLNRSKTAVTSGDDEFQGVTSGDENFQEKEISTDIELDEAKTKEEEKLKPPQIPTSVEQTPHGAPDGFKTRFRPTFDAAVGIFRATKRVVVADGVYWPGDFIYPEDEKIDARRMRLLFQQRYFDYPSNEEIEKFWNDPEARKKAREKSVENLKKDKEAEAKHEEYLKKRAAEDAKKDQANRAGNRNPIHDQNG